MSIPSCSTRSVQKVRHLRPRDEKRRVLSFLEQGSLNNNKQEGAKSCICISIAVEDFHEKGERTLTRIRYGYIA